MQPIPQDDIIENMRSTKLLPKIQGDVTMARQNKNLLEEIYKATKMGLEATQLIIPKVHDKSLRAQIEQQGKTTRE